MPCVLKTTVMKGLVGLKGGLKKQNKIPKTKKNRTNTTGGHTK